MKMACNCSQILAIICCTLGLETASTLPYFLPKVRAVRHKSTCNPNSKFQTSKLQNHQTFLSFNYLYQPSHALAYPYQPFQPRPASRYQTIQSHQSDHRARTNSLGCHERFNNPSAPPECQGDLALLSNVNASASMSLQYDYECRNRRTVTKFPPAEGGFFFPIIYFTEA